MLSFITIRRSVQNKVLLSSTLKYADLTTQYRLVRKVQSNARSFATESPSKSKTTLTSTPSPPPNVTPSAKAPSLLKSDVTKKISLKNYVYSGVLIFTAGLVGFFYFASQDDKLHDKLQEYAALFDWKRPTQSTPSTASSSSPSSSDVETKNTVLRSLQSLVHQVLDFNLFSNKKEETFPQRTKEDAHLLPSTKSINKPVPPSAKSTARSPTTSTEKTPATQNQAELSSSSSSLSSIPLLDPSDPKFLAFKEPFEKGIEELEALLDSLGHSIPHVQPSMKRMHQLVESLHRNLESLLKDIHAVKSQHVGIVEGALKKQSSAFDQTLEKALQKTLEAHELEKSNLKTQFLEELRNLELQFAELHVQDKTTWEAETERKLVNQENALKATWRKEMQAELDHERNGRLSKLDQLSLKLKHLEQSLDQLVDHRDRTSKLHALHLILQHLQYQIFENRQGFQHEWRQLERLAPLDPDFFRIILDSVDESHITGIIPLQDLHSHFTQHVAPQLRPLACVRDPERLGFFSYTIARLCSMLFIYPKVDLPDGKTILHVVELVEDALGNQDLDTAARTLNGLKGWPKQLVRDWLNQARRHLEVKCALDSLQSRAELLSLESCYC